MEQKMAQGAGLTSRQKQFLDLAIKDPYIVKTFYLSGGTALSYWYLHHRQSDDLDFFSTTPFDYERLVRWFHHNKQALAYQEARFDEDYGFLTVRLRFSDGSRLLVDFHHYSNTILEPGIIWRGLTVDSLFDITVNKMKTIATLPRTRDYIDLYFILKSKPRELVDLVEKITKKFKEHVDPILLAKNFLKVSEYTDFPKMLVPYKKEDVYD
ncbi:nucleotidyl transferase AbiEii/AbiGii toxin family protein, partial [Candidatus Gottesmanbacteria bacterium]|nr:nucleotidyl transferase AbiEii/AbiGii toxin family protein [Candidatus Gottesmanbacteria bacterium]